VSARWLEQRKYFVLNSLISTVNKDTEREWRIGKNIRLLDINKVAPEVVKHFNLRSLNEHLEQEKSVNYLFVKQGRLNVVAEVRFNTMELIRR
jgi:hypothetical protein